MTNHISAVSAVAAASAVASRADMTAALDIVTEAIERRNTLPILETVRMIGERGEFLFLTGTDNDVEISARIAAASDSSFASAVPACTLRDFLKKAPKSDYVAMSSAGVTVTADFERVRYTLQARDAADFPVMEATFGNHRFTMDGDAFHMALDRVKGAMSTEETRYYLRGVFMHICQHGALNFVTTDGHRLYRQRIDAPDGSEAIPSVIIPRKTVAVLHKLTKGKKCPQSVDIEVTDSRIRFGFETPDGIAVTVTSRIVDGTFPDYQRVIPTGNDKIAHFPVKDMAEAIKGVSLVMSERGRAIKLVLAGGNCRLTVDNPDQGSAEADVACDFGSDPLEIGFNYRYLAEILDIFGDNAEFAFADAGTPAVATADGIDGFTAVLMPMRI